MTNQTMPTDNTDKMRAILNDPSISATDAVKMINDLLPDPALPTLADMTEEKRLACMWMQADVKDHSTRYVIANAHNYIGDVGLISANGVIVWVSPDRVTPRPDLPRLVWPSDQKVDHTTTKNASTPALPGGWRAAKHPKHGIIIVTTDPDTYEYVDSVAPAENDPKASWLYCNSKELTYLDEIALPDNWRLADHPHHGRVIVTAEPDADGNIHGLILSTRSMGYDWLFCHHDVLTYLDTNQ